MTPSHLISSPLWSDAIEMRQAPRSSSPRTWDPCRSCRPPTTATGRYQPVGWSSNTTFGWLGLLWGCILPSLEHPDNKSSLSASFGPSAVYCPVRYHVHFLDRCRSGSTRFLAVVSLHHTLICSHVFCSARWHDLCSQLGQCPRSCGFHGCEHRWVRSYRVLTRPAN